jgi:hypothetical protein
MRLLRVYPVARINKDRTICIVNQDIVRGKPATLKKLDACG